MDEQLIPENIQKTLVEDEMKKSYVTYAMSVIVSRALPDVRDGLKPVHRRVLYGMENLGLTSGKSYKKSARIVGDVIGKYHPHGDTAVYHTLVRMAQEFSMRYCLVQGQGNFGSIDGDSPAAMRYTEARMRKISELMLNDLERETVDFSNNYDDSLMEPTVLPAAFPNLLVNGTTGIAVGMATNLAPHNLTEVINVCQEVIQNPEISSENLLNFVSGPDFPTGGIILGRSGIRSAYLTGKGKVTLQAKARIEPFKNDRERIVISEIPYQVNKSILLEKIATLVKNKEIEGVSDIRDESDRRGMNIIIEIKKDSFAEVILNQLYRYTQLKITFSINNLALVNGRPKILTLKELIEEFLKHRHEIVFRRTVFEKKKAKERVHILEGLRIAVQNIDEIIILIRAASDVDHVKKQLKERYDLTEKQSQAIVDMRLRSLTGLETKKIETEYQSLLITLEKLNEILSEKSLRMKIISDELHEIVKKHGDERRTVIEDVSDDITVLDLVPNLPMVITVSNAGYIKRIPVDTYKLQHKGGKGITAAGLKAEDFIEHLFVGWAHSYVLVFTNFGRCHWLRVFEIPESSRTTKGKALVNFLKLQEGERVSAFIPIKEFNEDQFLIFSTKQGVVNKMALNVFTKKRSNGVNAIKLDEQDELIKVLLAKEDDNIMIATSKGRAVRFLMSTFRQTNKNTRGVRGIQLSSDDIVIGMIVLEKDKTVLTLTDKGYGKKTRIEEYRITNRGGKGVRNINLTEKNGKAIFIASVLEKDELIILTRKGILIKTHMSEISLIGRSTQGNIVIRLGKDDVVADADVFSDISEIDSSEIESFNRENATVKSETDGVLDTTEEINEKI